jgi:membrane protein DedA with SNARE-associated domain
MTHFIGGDQLLPLILQDGLFVVALLIFVGQLGVPIGVPAELLLVLAGSYAVHSVAALLAGLCLLATADVLGSVALFLLARRGGAGLVARIAGRRRGAHRASSPRWQDRLHSRGVVFLVRSLPLVRIYGAVGSGLVRTRTRDYLAGAVPAGLLWAGAPLTLGFLLREHVAGIAAGYPTGILSLVAVVPGLVMTFVVVRRRWRPQPIRAPAPVLVVPVLALPPVSATVHAAAPAAVAGRCVRPVP